MKKLFYPLMFVYSALVVFTGIFMSSCEEKHYDKKDNIYAEKHMLYSTKDTLYSNITVYYTKVKGHDVVYHIFNGKNKSQMEIWHFENECAKCKKGLKK